MVKLFGFRHAKKMYYIFAAIGLLLIIIAQSPFTITVQWILMIFGALLILGAFVWVLVFYKCPYCHERLPLSHSLPEYCPSCGEKLQD